MGAFVGPFSRNNPTAVVISVSITPRIPVLAKEVGLFSEKNVMADEKRCLTKADLTNVLYDLLWQDQIDRQRCAAIVEDYIELIKDGLAKDGKVMISGFGSYEVNYKEPRRGRNPQTGETMILRERRVVKFKPSQLLRKDLNED